MAKTILVSQVGGPEVMKVADVEPGHPGPGEIRLRQTAMGVNFGDIHKRRGTAPPHAMAEIRFPFTPGLEAVGIVEEVGAGVSEFKVGDRVAYAVPSMLGGYADGRLFPAKRAFKVPDGVADTDAAALLYKGITVQGLIKSCFVVQPGHVLLVHAAAGGVGTILCRWAHQLGATVIGTVSTQDKAAKAKSSGCEHVIVTARQPFPDAVLALTNGVGVDAVYDGVGQDVFLDSFTCLRKYGTMISYGQTSGMPAPLDPVMLQHKGHYLTKFSGSTYNADLGEYRKRVDDVFAAMAAGLLPLGTHAIYKLDDVVTAHRDFEARRTTGSVVLIA
jgi:NADPH2:quinone reductase